MRERWERLPAAGALAYSALRDRAGWPGAGARVTGAEGEVEVARGVDERDVGEGLGHVAQRFAGEGVDHL